MWNGRLTNAEEMDITADEKPSACTVLENEWDDLDENENGMDPMLWIVGDRNHQRPWWER